MSTQAVLTFACCLALALAFLLVYVKAGAAWLRFYSVIGLMIWLAAASFVVIRAVFAP